MVKKLEKKAPEVDEPWALATWMKKKGYKMPAEEYDPTTGGKRILAPVKKAEEEISPYSAPKIPKPKSPSTMDEPLGMPKRDVKRKSVVPGELRAEETMKTFHPKKFPEKPDFVKMVETEKKRRESAPGVHAPTGKIIKAEEEPLPQTPKERMQTYKPKGTKPTFIDTKPSGQGKPLEQYAEEVGSGKGDYTKWLREKDEKKGVLGKIKEKLVGEEEERRGGVGQPRSIYGRRSTFEKPMDLKKTIGTTVKHPVTQRTLTKATPTKLKHIETQRLKQKAEEEQTRMYDPKEMEMGMKEEMEHAETVGGDKNIIKKIVEDHLNEDPHYYTKLHAVFHAEDDFKAFDASALIDYHNFMSWMNEKGYKANDEEELEKKMNEYEVDKFSKEAEEMQPKPQFTAPEEAGVMDTLKKLDPKPAMPKNDSVPNLTKHIVRQVSEEAGVMDKVKEVVKKLDPAPAPIKDDNLPPLTKKTQTNVVRKIKSGV